jgi:DNA-binding transcriptional LysR family regulator
MEHRQLLNFLSVCEKKSFLKASEQRFISQQGLSKSIKQLEEQLGVPLFYRTARGIDLTEFGYAIKEAAHSYINHHDQIVDAVRKLKEKHIDRLTIGMIIGFHDNFPPCFFKNFMVNHPDISLDIMTFPDNRCQESLLRHKIPLGFSCAPIDADTFDSVYCLRSKLALIVGKEHPFARRPFIHIKELQNEKAAIVNSRMYPFSIIAVYLGNMELSRRSIWTARKPACSMNYAARTGLSAFGRAPSGNLRNWRAFPLRIWTFILSFIFL